MTASIEIARIIEFGEVAAYADQFLKTPPPLMAQLGVAVKQFGSAVGLTCRAFDIMLFNRVVGLGLQETAQEAQLEEIVAHYRALGVRNFGIQLSPTAQPTELPGWLTAHGFVALDSWSKVIHRPEPPPSVPTDLRIETIGPEHAQAFAQVATVAFGMPPAMQPWLQSWVGLPNWHYYLAFDGNKPVATGALFVRGEVGWLGAGSTLSTHRGRGAQGAIMACRIRDGLDLGCRWLVTETGQETPGHPNPSYHNMLRTGFTLVYHRPNYYLRSNP